MRSQEMMDRVPAAQMAPREFCACAIVVGVEVNPDPSAPRRLNVPYEEADRFEALRAEISRVMPHLRRGLDAQAQQALESRLIAGLMSLPLDTADAVCNRLPGGRPVVLARIDLIHRFGHEAVAARAHREEVFAAHSRGDPLPNEILEHYRIHDAKQQPSCAAAA